MCVAREDGVDDDLRAESTRGDEVKRERVAREEDEAGVNP